jgi:hypothetical protein
VTDVDQQSIKPKNRPWPTFITREVRKLKGYLQKRRAKTEKPAPSDHAATSLAKATWAIAVLTLATIGVGFFQYLTLKGQLDAMENDKRPWLNAEIVIPDPVLITEWAGARGINLPLKLSLKNHGQQPAINVRAYPTVMLHPGNERREELGVRQREICDGASTESDKDPIGGIAVFPGETSAIETRIGVSGNEIFKNGEPVLFALLGCLDYSYGGGKHGQTGFRYVIGKATGDYVLGVPFIEGTPIEGYHIPDDAIKAGMPATPPKQARIPAGQLYFKPMDSGNYAK